MESFLFISMLMYHNCNVSISGCNLKGARSSKTPGKSVQVCYLTLWKLKP